MGLYTDASVAKRLAAIAVVQRTGIVTQVVRRDSIGWASTCGVLSAEITAIAAALEYAQEHLTQVQQLVVFSESQQALRAIQAGNDARTGRALLSKIAESIGILCRAGIDLRFRWSPGHEGIVGNEEADDAAREASSHTGKPTAPALERLREVAGVIRLIIGIGVKIRTRSTRGCPANIRGRWIRPYQEITPYSYTGCLRRTRLRSSYRLERDIAG